MKTQLSADEVVKVKDFLDQFSSGSSLSLPMAEVERQLGAVLGHQSEVMNIIYSKAALNHKGVFESYDELKDFLADSFSLTDLPPHNPPSSDWTSADIEELMRISKEREEELEAQGKSIDDLIDPNEPMYDELGLPISLLEQEVPRPTQQPGYEGPEENVAVNGMDATQGEPTDPFDQDIDYGLEMRGSESFVASNTDSSNKKSRAGGSRDRLKDGKEPSYSFDHAKGRFGSKDELSSQQQPQIVNQSGGGYPFKPPLASALSNIVGNIKNNRVEKKRGVSGVNCKACTMSLHRTRDSLLDTLDMINSGVNKTGEPATTDEIKRLGLEAKKHLIDHISAINQAQDLFDSEDVDPDHKIDLMEEVSKSEDAVKDIDTSIEAAEDDPAKKEALDNLKGVLDSLMRAISRIFGQRTKKFDSSSPSP